ncbi:MAG: FTR1 family protein [Acidimicrobiales bacterium]
MGAALLITLREGLEISLVVAIIAAYLVKTGRGDRLGAMWLGVGAAVVASIACGVLFKAVIGEFEGKWEQAIEGVLAFLAVGVLTWMIFWMRRNAKNISGELHEKIDAALAQSPMALSVIAFVAVAREGFETAPFLLGAETGSSSGTSVVVGGLIGLAIATVVGIALYTGSARVDLRSFFQWTGLLLILFAAGLFAKGLHEFRELFEIESSLIADTVWTVSSGPSPRARTCTTSSRACSAGVPTRSGSG